MAEFVLYNPKIYVAQYDFSGEQNRVSLMLAADQKDSSEFGDTTHKNINGATMVTYAGGGLVDLTDEADSPEAFYFDRIAFNEPETPVTLVPDGGAVEGDPSFCFPSIFSAYNPMYEWNELVRYEINGGGREMPGRGVVAVSPAAAKVASGNSATGYLIGAVAAGKKVAASIHLLAATGLTSLDVTIESDTAAGFPSPVTRITFPTLAAVGSDFLTAVGPITDTYWRAKWTLVGTSARFVVAIGLQP